MVKYLGQNYILNANRSGFRSPIGWRWVQSFAPINSPSTAFCSIFGSTYTEAWTGQWIINIHTHGAVRWRIQGTTGCHTPHMGIKMIDLAKWHNPPLLSATTMEFPLSGVKHPPLALRRPWVFKKYPNRYRDNLDFGRDCTEIMCTDIGISSPQ